MLNLKNTLDGYLKNVEVIGNTVQDTNNLANIRSVGDKVEGQELYNISIQVDNGDGVSEVVEILSPVQLEKVGNVVDRIICKDGVWGVDKKVDAEVKNNVLVNARTNSEFIPLPHDQQVKLRTFAGQTNITFLTETPGQIKAQVPKSLGATVNAHTEQIKDLHNSLDRVKKLEETTVSTVETESNFTTISETSNGYFEDIKLEGKTLVVNSNNEEVEPGTNGATLKSVGQDVDKIIIKSVNENLFDESSLDNYIINSDEGTFSLDYGKMYQDNYIYPLKPNNQLTFSYICKETTGGNKNPRFGFLYDDDSYTYVNVVPTTNFEKYEKASLPNKKLIGIKAVFGSSGGNWVIKKNSIMLNTGSTSKEFIPHKSNKKRVLYYNEVTQTWEKPVLRKGDTIEKHSDGKYYYHKRSGEVVLNGSEGWGVSKTNENTIILGMSHNPKIKGDNGRSCVICDRFISFGADAQWLNANQECIAINKNGQILIQISKSKLTTQDMEGFKAWLKANPITVVYQLAQEEVYECTNIDLMTYSGETNYIVNSGAISPKSLIKVHNNISNVVEILQEKVSLLENTFIAGLKSVLSGDMYSLATILYPEDFEQNDNTEQDIMVTPE